jgi:DNA-directed RNA polymerase specialized sigma24 family protein/outer membrane biosynthesis protein TonB
MSDSQLAVALRSRSPEALTELLDAYGDQLFSYCWCMLRNRENAQVAVRDALVVATAQIGRLVFDEWLGLWLYSLARGECLRREAAPAADADEPAAVAGTDDADSRLMAWKAVTNMPADEVEALELSTRHEVDLRLVLGLPEAEVQALLDRARRDLQRTLAAEILIKLSPACPDRSALMSGWTDTTTSAQRDRLLEHAAGCPVCGLDLPRSVSPARVFGLLPAPVLSSAARLEVLGFFGDSGMAAYREFTVSRAAELSGSCFLSIPEPAEPAPDPESTGSSALSTEEPTGPAPAPDPAQPAPAVEPEPDPAQPASAVEPEPDPAQPASAVEPDPEPDPDPVQPALPESAQPAPAGEVPPRPPVGPRPGRRRPRASRIGVAALAAVAVTAVLVLVDSSATPSVTPSVTAASAPSAATEGLASATGQPGGRAGAALPVKVDRSSHRRTGPFQPSVATKTELLPVAAVSLPGTLFPSLPSPQPPASSGTPSANGSLGVTPDRLNLGSGTTGQLTLTAMGGPVSWSAGTSSALVTLSSQRGTLRAGQSVTLVVSVSPGSGDATVFVDSSPAASQSVEVTWTSSPASSPAPSPTPSTSTSPPARRPHPRPRPSPSRSSSPSPSQSPSPSSS